MCDTIDSKYILVNYFMKHNREISIANLKRIRNRIEKRLPSVMVDISYLSISSAIDTYPRLFTWNNDSIVKAKGAETYFNDDYISNEFNKRLPVGIRNRMLQLL